MFSSEYILKNMQRVFVIAKSFDTHFKFCEIGPCRQGSLSTGCCIKKTTTNAQDTVQSTKQIAQMSKAILSAYKFIKKYE
jgi:hypothetical protein